MLPLEIINGSFYRDGVKILPTGPVYFGRTPGTCGGYYFADPHWQANEAWMERDFALMRQVGFTWAVPFINASEFWREGRPVEEYFDRVGRMIELARRNDFYLIPFPNIDRHAAASVLGRADTDAARFPCGGMNQAAFSSFLFEALTRSFTEFAVRFGDNPVIPLWMNQAGGRLWTGYAGFRPGEPEAAELLPVRPFWQAWLCEQYEDDFAAFLREHPLLPEQPRRWEEVLLPTEVPGQFTQADSRTFDFLRFQAQTTVATSRRFFTEVHKQAPHIKKMGVHEGCEFCTGPQENYLPGLGDFDAVWCEMYGFNMAYGSHISPDWRRVGFTEPTTGKAQIDSLSVCSEAWERCRYFKAAAPHTALIPCHGSVMQAYLRWALGEREQRILFERLQRVYQEAGADGLGFWCWTDDNSSARPEPEFFHREGETMGVIDLQGRYRPVARRMRTYLSAAAGEPRVSPEVLLLVPTASRLGLPQADSNMTVACLTSALARLGIQPDVKHTFYQGKGPIAQRELDPFKVVIVATDKYHRDFPEVPEALLAYTKRGGRVLLALGESSSRLYSPRGEAQDNPALAETPRRPGHREQLPSAFQPVDRQPALAIARRVPALLGPAPRPLPAGPPGKGADLQMGATPRRCAVARRSGGAGAL